RLQSGAHGVLQGSASTWGRFFACTQFAGSRGTLWIEGDEVWVADRSGPRQLDLPADLAVLPPSPPPLAGPMTAHDLMHLSGIDFGPYVRLYERFRDLILGRPVPPDPRAATFADGVAGMIVLDAVRRSAAGEGWVAISAPG